MSTCDQAAILCGGMGQRLRPITDRLPKPMAPLNGRPFLCFLLDQLKENGIRKIVLMTGYLGEQIRQYFGNGEDIGLRILYSHGPAEWETGRRLYEARGLLKEKFLLLYSDNFVQFSLRRMERFYRKSGKVVSLVVYPKKKGNNIEIADDGTVLTYDKSRTARNLKYVELGYMLVDRKVFDFYDEIDISFSDILHKLAVQRQLAGMIVKDDYYSISDPARLALTEKYLMPKKIILIDRDGVINEKAPRGEYVSEWKSFRFIMENVRGLKKLASAGFKFIVISNQAGIGRGIMTSSQVAEVNDKMKKVLADQGINILSIYVCPHHWEEKCYCRKPNPGLFFQVSRDWLVRLDKAFYIGDDPRDCTAAFNAGARCVFVGNREELGGLPETEQPQLVCKTLYEAVPHILEET